MENHNSTPEQSYQTLFVVWAALLMSQFLLVGMAFFIKPELFKFDLSKPLLGDNSIAVIALAAISATCVVLSLVMRRRFVEQAITERKVELVQTGMIIGCALSEAVSMFGLFLAFAFNYQYFFLFSVVGVAATLLHFPNRSNVHAAGFKS